MKTLKLRILLILMVTLTVTGCKPEIYNEAGIEQAENSRIVAGIKENLLPEFGATDTATTITTDLSLPASTTDGVEIQWTSNHLEIISETGSVIRPFLDTEVILSATISKGKIKDTKLFTVNVMAAGWTNGSIIAELPGYILAIDTTFDNEGNTYMTGYTEQKFGKDEYYPGACPAFISKYSRTGIFLWARTFGKPGSVIKGTSNTNPTIQNPFNYGTSVACSDDGSIYMTGICSVNFDDKNFTYDNKTGFLCKFSKDGNLLWKQFISQDASFKSANNSVVIGKDNSIYICGETTQDVDGNTLDDCKGFISKYRSSGEHLWTTVLSKNTIPCESVRSMIILKNNNILTLGYSHNVNNYYFANYSCTLIELKPDTGNIVSQKIVSDPNFSIVPGNRIGGGQNMIEDNQSNVYICGTAESNNPSVTSYFVAKTNPSGSLLWFRTPKIEGTPTTDASLITLTKEGQVMICGNYTNYSSGMINDVSLPFDSIHLQLSYYSPEGQFLKTGIIDTGSKTRLITGCRQRDDGIFFLWSLAFTGDFESDKERWLIKTIDTKLFPLENSVPD